MEVRIMGPGSLVKEMLRTAGSYSPECVEGKFCEVGMRYLA
jgi:hypothetical protein